MLFLVQTDKGNLLRKSALLAVVCAILLFAPFASAQHTDIMVGGGILESLTKPTDVATFQPPQEKVGLYPSIAGNFYSSKHRFGLNVEGSWRYHLGNYYGYETYRPIFIDANALYQSQLTRRVGLDLMGGIGVASNRFNLLASCSVPGCINYTSSTHFMEDLALGVRYRFWRRFFVRPEAHYYHIQHNEGFNSDNVFRIGASIGYRFGEQSTQKKKAPAPK